jgi:ABC-type nitrate/sulfonate/bicarbonate transport system substrate-binding protein
MRIAVLSTARLRALIFALLLLVVAVAVSACGSSSSSSSTSAASGARLQNIRISLDYTANVDYLGIYAAKANGYFTKHGVSPTIIPYAETPAETLIQSGKTDLGISYPPQLIISRSQGLKYKAVAALVSADTTALAVLANSGITSPAQLSGKLYGGFGLTGDAPTIKAIMKAAGAPSPRFREVVLNTDALQALAAHRVDYTAVFEGTYAGELPKGVKLRLFPYSKYLGQPGNFPNAVYVASDHEIETHGAVLKATLAALAEGYEWAAAHPQAAGQILVRENETSLGSSQKIIAEESAAIAPRFLDASGAWGPLDGATFTGLAKILGEGGVVHGAVPTESELLTNDLLPSG